MKPDFENTLQLKRSTFTLNGETVGAPIHKFEPQISTTGRTTPADHSLKFTHVFLFTVTQVGIVFVGIE